MVSRTSLENLQQQAEAIREAELARSQSKLAGLTPQQREAVESLTRALTAKLLHPQLTALREATRQAEARNLGDQDQ